MFEVRFVVRDNQATKKVKEWFNAEEQFRTLMVHLQTTRDGDKKAISRNARIRDIK